MNVHFIFQLSNCFLCLFCGDSSDFDPIDFLSFGRFGKIKGSIGSRAINGVSVPAVNIGYEVSPAFFGKTTFSGEFRGR